MERDILAKATAWFAGKRRARRPRVFELVNANQADLPGATRCAACWSVSASGYYAWRDRAPSATRDRRCGADRTHPAASTPQSDETYGMPRVRAELRRRRARASAASAWPG